MPKPKPSVTFEPIEDCSGMYHCYICGVNPATLKCSGTRNGFCCLQCAFKMLTEVAQWTVEHIKRTR